MSAVVLSRRIRHLPCAPCSGVGGCGGLAAPDSPGYKSEAPSVKDTHAEILGPRQQVELADQTLWEFQDNVDFQHYPLYFWHSQWTQGERHARGTRSRLQVRQRRYLEEHSKGGLVSQDQVRRALPRQRILMDLVQMVGFPQSLMENYAFSRRAPLCYILPTSTTLTTRSHSRMVPTTTTNVSRGSIGRWGAWVQCRGKRITSGSSQALYSCDFAADVDAD